MWLKTTVSDILQCYITQDQPYKISKNEEIKEIYRPKKNQYTDTNKKIHIIEYETLTERIYTLYSTTKGDDVAES